MKIIAVIPARGGSKRIPRKNIIDFMGKPLITWTIEAAKKIRLFNRIIISTDDKEIADVAIRSNIPVPFLRTDKSDDITPVSEATLLSVLQAEEFYQESYDIVVQLMPNVPLRNEVDITSHLNTFIQGDKDSQISCFKFGWMNPWWAFKVNIDGSYEWLMKEGVGTRSQDLDDLYCPTGAIWIAKANSLKKFNSFYGDNCSFCELDWKRSVDIDNYEDLDFAKALYILENNERYFRKIH